MGGSDIREAVWSYSWHQEESVLAAEQERERLRADAKGEEARAAQAAVEQEKSKLRRRREAEEQSAKDAATLSALESAALDDAISEDVGSANAARSLGGEDPRLQVVALQPGSELQPEPAPEPVSDLAPTPVLAPPSGATSKFMLMVAKGELVEESTLVRVEASSLADLINQLAAKVRADLSAGAELHLLTPGQQPPQLMNSFDEVPSKGKVQLLPAGTRGGSAGPGAAVVQAAVSPADTSQPDTSLVSPAPDEWRDSMIFDDIMGTPTPRSPAPPVTVVEPEPEPEYTPEYKPESEYRCDHHVR